MKKSLFIYIICPVLFAFYSCEKFLSERYSNSVSNVSTHNDLQSLLDAGNRINYGSYSGLIEAATDNFFLNENGLNMAAEYEKDIYIWKESYIYPTVGEQNIHWTNPFHAITISNVVIEELPNVKNKSGFSSESILGAALFTRAFSYLQLVQIYCNAYDPVTSKTDLGLPLRTTADIYSTNNRSTLEDTFEFIVDDILNSIELLPWNSEFKTRPNKVAAHALLARCYLLMGKYNEALTHSEIALRYYEKLMDFNDLNLNANFPIQAMNDETIYFAYATGVGIHHPRAGSFIDTTLYESYHDNDLRKYVYFKYENNGFHSFRGSFVGNGNINIFLGLTTSELYLIMSECLARTENKEQALNVLQSLLKMRYKNNEVDIVELQGGKSVLEFILEERRKELINRGARWSDLKRLNKDPRFAKTLIRKLPNDSITYTLPPNDSRYLFLIPQGVISLTKIKQNDR